MIFKSDKFNGSPKVRAEFLQTQSGPTASALGEVSERIGTEGDVLGLDSGGGDSGDSALPVELIQEKTDESDPDNIVRVGDELSDPSLDAPLLNGEPVTLKEILETAARDSLFFCKYYFPKTFRQDFASFHPVVFGLLDDPSKRYINLQIGRDGAKTTCLRAYTAKRVAYMLSRTILYIGASQDKAKQSVGWLKRQIEVNKKFTSHFGLSPGVPWTDEHIVIKHGPEEATIHVLAYGITGSTRGVNLDDYRPDLIIIDDCMNEENSGTKEQRTKIEDLVLGALKESLSPATETPDAKMVLLNTPQDMEDLSQKALKDTQFYSARFGCWTPETEELPVEMQESSWPARYPSETLRAEKIAAIARNKYSIFSREKEVKLTTPETAAFKPEWIKYFGEGEEEGEPPRHEMWVEMVIDPVPPPSDKAVAAGDLKTDFEALSVVGRWRNKYYSLETVYNRGHDPSWTVTTFFELANRWNPRKVLVEAVAYQRTLSWLLKEGMRRTGRYWPVEEFNDKRKKYTKIVDGLNGPLSHGQLFVRKTQTTLISQITHYPGKNPRGTHDDVIETIALGCTSLAKGFVGDEPDELPMFEENIPDLGDYRGAP